jgi:hypothetical protein
VRDGKLRRLIINQSHPFDNVEYIFQPIGARKARSVSRWQQGGIIEEPMWID